MTDRGHATTLRDVLVQAVNGNPVTADEAWALIHKWDELSNLAATARNVSAAPEYDEEAIRAALWAIVEAVPRG